MGTDIIMHCICGLIIVFVLSGIICTIYAEIRDFNNGYCPRCGKKLKHFDNDSQGGRGYCCDDCGYTTWVSYYFVDKNNKNNHGKKN